MQALAASCEELRARTGKPPLHNSRTRRVFHLILSTLINSIFGIFFNLFKTFHKTFIIHTKLHSHRKATIYRQNTFSASFHGICWFIITAKFSDANIYFRNYFFLIKNRYFACKLIRCHNHAASLVCILMNNPSSTYIWH